jgi:hypothetical protein
LRRKTPDGKTWTPIVEAMNLSAVADGAGGQFFDVYCLEAGAATTPQGAAASVWF